MVPFGMGSSMEGHVNAVRGGITIDLTRMTRVLRVGQDDLDVTVEAGITRKTLDGHLKNTGLMFPIDPGADATIGGMAATRASGTTAVRYGTMRENVLGLTVVLADGRVIHTGSRARKSSAGYDLTRLFVGSEGTLGVITEVTLRLFGRPEAIAAAVCPFASMEGAVNTVIQTIQLGIPVARMEVIDQTQLAIVNRFSKTSYPEAPTLFFEFHGTSQAVGGRRGAHGRGDRPRAGCARLPMGVDARGTRPALAGAARRPITRRSRRAPARGHDHGRLRAHLTAGAVHPGDGGGRPRLGHPRAAGRPRRRRKLPPDPDARSGGCRGVDPRLGLLRAPRRARARASAAPAAASTAWGSGR